MLIATPAPSRSAWHGARRARLGVLDLDGKVQSFRTSTTARKIAGKAKPPDD
jgi:hypothetical protein